MRYLTRILLTAFVLVLTLAFATPAQAGMAHPVPIKGTLVGVEYDYPADTWEAFPFAEKEQFVVGGETYDCGTPVIEMVLGSYVGEFSHLGRTTLDLWACNAIDWGTGELYMAAGRITLTAANGDTLAIVPAGDVVLGEPSDGYVDFVAPFEFASGTGRFADASGTLTEIGRSTWPDLPTGSEPWVRELTGTFRGEITYDASNRAAM